jgi:hypothetical protein
MEEGEATVDDLREIEQLFQIVDDDVTPRARQRARVDLMQAIAAEERVSVSTTARTRRRGVSALALVAMVAALAFAAPSLVSHSGSSASAADVLLRLAGRAQAGWESPRGEQLIYTKMVGQRWDCQGGSCSIVDFERESWVAFNGSGRIRELVDGTLSDETYPSGALSFNEMTETLGEDLPGLRHYVESLMPAGVEPTDFALFVTISDLLGETQGLPEARMALFRLAATLPGARALGTITDATGRPGVGIEYGDGAVSRQIVFNPDSALVLGVLNVAADGSETRPPTRSEVALGVVPGTSETYVDSGLVSSTQDRSVIGAPPSS